MRIETVKKILSKLSDAPKKWELDEIVYYDRDSNSNTLKKFLERIQELSDKKSNIKPSEKIELTYLRELLEDMNEEEK
jgi:coenzyme F420-reducing hydrogenase delta subunit